jgi:hypothetical protein
MNTFTFSKILFVLCLCLFTTFAFAVDNKVTKVYSCNNDIGIEIESIGWVVILESEVGEKRVDRMLAIALSLLATQAPVGYLNTREPINWCGISDVKPISVLQIMRR